MRTPRVAHSLCTPVTAPANGEVIIADASSIASRTPPSLFVFVLFGFGAPAVLAGALSLTTFCCCALALPAWSIANSPNDTTTIAHTIREPSRSAVDTPFTISPASLGFAVDAIVRRGRMFRGTGWPLRLVARRAPVALAQARVG